MYNVYLIPGVVKGSLEYVEREIREGIMTGHKDSRQRAWTYQPRMMDLAKESGRKLLDRAKILKDFVKKFIEDKQAENGIEFDLMYFFYEYKFWNSVEGQIELAKANFIDKCDRYCDLTMHLLLVFPKFNGILTYRHKLFIIGQLQYYNWYINRGLASHYDIYLRKKVILDIWFSDIAKEAIKSFEKEKLQLKLNALVTQLQKDKDEDSKDELQSKIDEIKEELEKLDQSIYHITKIQEPRVFRQRVSDILQSIYKKSVVFEKKEAVSNPEKQPSDSMFDLGLGTVMGRRTHKKRRSRPSKIHRSIRKKCGKNEKNKY